MLLTLPPYLIMQRIPTCFIFPAMWTLSDQVNLNSSLGQTNSKCLTESLSGHLHCQNPTSDRYPFASVLGDVSLVNFNVSTPSVPSPPPLFLLRQLCRSWRIFWVNNPKLSHLIQSPGRPQCLSEPGPQQAPSHCSGTNEQNLLHPALEE